MNNPDPYSVLDELPGDLMMWVLIVSELLIFGTGLLAFLAVRISDVGGFAAAQDMLNRTAAGINTVILITSGYLAARASIAANQGKIGRTRLYLAGAALLGVVFLIIKGGEYAEKIALGITTDTHPFFTFYYLLTGFHAAHVLAGILILGLIGWRAHPRTVQVGVAFWHMVDLVWVLLFPIIYLLR